MNELVSIVIPIYNMGHKIVSSMEYILQQTYEDIEVILVDDGSTDDSLVNCHKIAQKDNRVKVFHTSNRGSGPARNVGIESASGKYIYFPDADDKLEKDAIKILVETMESNECDLVVFGYRNVGLRGQIISEKRYKEDLDEGEKIRADYYIYYAIGEEKTIQGAPWNKFFSKEIIDRFGVRYPALRRHQDEAFIGRYMCYVRSVKFVRDVLYNYYVNDLSLEWDKYPKDYFQIARGLFEERKSNILQWNKEDDRTHELVYLEYIYNSIKGLELSFSPKYKLSCKDRMEWIKDKCKGSEFLEISLPKSIHRYQRIVHGFLRKKLYRCAYLTMHLKIVIEKRLR